jgi:hypothetical protein
METMRVLVANELCTYRETIAEVLQEFRPHVEIHCVDPDDLDHEIARLRPHMVLCSRLTDAVQSLLAWILLYPNGENHAVISTAGEIMMVVDIEFGHLLSTLDQAQLLYHGPRVETA